jgi:hypothetical protein
MTATALDHFRRVRVGLLMCLALPPGHEARARLVPQLAEALAVYARRAAAVGEGPLAAQADGARPSASRFGVAS